MQPGPIESVEELEEAVETLMRELTSIAEAAAPRRKRNTSSYAPWWNREIDEAMREARRAGRAWRSCRTPSAHRHYQLALTEFDRLLKRA
jgi:hypothetical protein